MKPLRIDIRPCESGGFIAWVIIHGNVIEILRAPLWGVLQNLICESGYRYLPETWSPRVFLDKPRNQYYGCIG